MKKEKILSFLLIITFLFFCCITTYACINSSFRWLSDDFYYARYEPQEGYFKSLDIINFYHGGGYLGLFLCKFLSTGLPILLDIHPSDFISYGEGPLRAILTISILLSFLKFFTCYNKSKLLFFALFIFLNMYTLFHGLQSCIYNENYAWYRYFFSLFFYGCFWIYMNQQIFSNMEDNAHRKKLTGVIWASICGYIIGTSSEIVFFSSLMTCGLLVIYNYTINIIAVLNKNIEKNILKYSIDNFFCIPIIFLLTAITLFITSKGYNEVASDRGMSNIHITIENIKEFTQLYINKVFLDEIYIHIIFLILIITSYLFAKKQNEIKNIFLPIFMYISTLTVLYSLILCGKTYHDNLFFIEHPNIIFVYRMLILFPVLLLIGYISNNLLDLNIKKKNILLLLSTLFIISFSIIIYYKNIYNAITENNWFKQQKQIQYMTEKIIRFYNIQGEVAKIPSSMLKKADNIIPNHNIIDVIDHHKPLYIESMIKTYKDENARLGFTFEEDALKKFYEDGGCFYKYELEHVIFSRLKNKDFILNKSIKPTEKLDEKFIL